VLDGIKRILVVDDEAANRRLLGAMLIGEGFDVIEAPDGPGALEALSLRPIDVVLLDIVMAGMSGFEVCRRIRGERDISHVPVVFVTGLDHREARIRAAEVGADDFLTRPVDDVQLLARINSLVRAKRHHDEIERQRHLMQAVLGRISEGVVAVDREGHVILSNLAAAHLVGEPAAALARPGQQPGVAIARALAGQVSSDLKTLVRHPGQPDGRYLNVSALPLEDRGRPGGAVAVLRDVTRLVELDRFKEDLTSLLVHELKNLISVIRSSLDFAIESVDGDVAVTDAMVDAKHACARGLRLMANLLDITRLEGSRAALSPIRIEVAALFDGVVCHRTAKLAELDVALDVSAGSAASVTADQEMLIRVVENTLDNAMRHVLRGGRLSLRAAAVGDDHVQIRIGNSGPAIPAEYRETIFEKTDLVPVGPGMMPLGLGLYFSRLAIAAHGGRMWVESTEELPTIFVIELNGTAVDDVEQVEQVEQVAPLRGAARGMHLGPDL
jgi:DNA-binding response OmpR family regulator